MDTNLKGRDVLLAREKGSNKLQVADRDGKLKAGKPDSGDNPDFLKIDRQGNVLENFFQNFMRQTKNPTEFEFFRVPVEKFHEVLKKLQAAFKNPDRPENRELMNMHRVEPEAYLKTGEQSQEHPKPAYSAIDESHVDWEQFERIGVTRDTLAATKNLEKILNWLKTDLLPIALKFDDLSLRTDARLALRETPAGNLSLSIHAVRHKPELERPYFGVKFTDEDRKNLLSTGNLGRIVEAEFKKGEKTPVFLSVDRQTNELVACKAGTVKIPESIRGAELSDGQRMDLATGKAVWLEDMTAKSGKPFSAYLQFNAEKRGFEFRFDSDRAQGQKQKHEKHDSQKKDVPKTFRKKELTGEQRDSLREGKTVHTGELTDKKGKKYSGYITLNGETGKTDFIFPKEYKDALAAGKVIPDDRHKTQAAINNEGKTGEATKNVKEPLEKGQSQPTEKQAEKQQKEEKTKKSKGVKM